MASYFDVKPPSKATAEVLDDVPDDPELKSMGMLTPQVTRILDNLDLEEHSSSDGEPSLSEDSDPPNDPKKLPKSQSSPLSETKDTRLAPPPRPVIGAGSGRERHPRLARFHSLRSMLFSSKIEDGLAKHDEARAKAESEEKWRAEHEQRKGFNRPKTPESPKGSPTKEGFAHRMGDKLRRMTSKEVPTMKDIQEEYDNESTASSEDEDAHLESIPTDRGGDNESIHHSDVEDLVRWVSRRDPPSDGEIRRKKEMEQAHEDSGHESLGHSDVDDLVQWVSRKEPEQKTDRGFDYSDAPTEEDSEAGTPRKETMGEQDVDELVRWISHKEGPKAGPVRDSKVASSTKKEDSQDAHEDSDGAELSRWVTRKDETSGESDFTGDQNAIQKPTTDEEPRGRSPRREDRESLTHTDVNELIRWVSRRENAKDEEERDEGIMRWKKEEDEKKKALGMRQDQGSLQPADVDELVRWVSKREASSKDDEERDDGIMEWKIKQDEKKKDLGMREDKGSLQPDEVDELVQWVSRS
ncbi:hypothetical protein K505DRAFT_277267 [Melanomma pulvis-pyrius CBS 109.77]|uniref:Uncharacterized protein n=1 Tax=Melanomma pulvis-pyrius CBS 109.77 TaxID=1314802 RepID=A0A6A6XBB4_9PLEO|nr:hypothetical protein K505DRAFT_277267 [Melanomma pulvis-pyrius CBS 109.77]